MEKGTKYHKALKLREKQRAKDKNKLFGASYDAIDGTNDSGNKKDDATVGKSGGKIKNTTVEDDEAVIDEPVVVIDEPKANTMTNIIDNEMSVESEISVVDTNR